MILTILLGEYEALLRARTAKYEDAVAAWNTYKAWGTQRNELWTWEYLDTDEAWSYE